jgi:hypothetical protein
MRHKLRSFFFTLLISLAASSPALAQGSIFEHELLGQCFDNAPAFTRKALSEGALSDPNISTTAKAGWTWVVDQTASKNYSWYLLREEGKQICLRVFVPTASYVQIKKYGHTHRIEAFIAPEANFPGKRVEMSLRNAAKFATTSRCYLLPHSRKVRAKRVPCDRILD